MFPLFSGNRVDGLILSATYLIWVIPEIMLSRSRRPRADAKARDRRSAALLITCIWTGIAIAWGAAYVAPQFAIRWDRPYLFAAGIVLMLAGVAFRWYCIRVLGRYFTVVVAIQPDHIVIDKGPYGLLRHPSYSGALLTILGFGLVFTNWLSLATVLVFAAAGYGYRIAVEERALLEALGEPYREYMKRTKRIIPFVI